MEDYKKIDDYYFKPTGKPLGKGAFSTVYKGYQGLETQIPVAIKVIPAVKMLESQENYDLFMREIDVLRQIKGENIVQLLDVKRTPNNLYLFTEFCNGGDLDTALKKNGPMSEEDALEIVYQFSAAFNTINNLDIKNRAGRRVIIMHRDIKPANILFHDGVMKIADFGFAKMIDEAAKNVKMQHTLLGTPLYMSPQILNDESYTPKCDIWSTGVVVYECLFKKLPWTGTSIAKLYKSIKQTPLSFPKEVGEEIQDLLSKMLQIDESKRISWKEIEEHPAVKAGAEIFKKRHPKKEVETSPSKTDADGTKANNNTIETNKQEIAGVNAGTNAGTGSNSMGLQAQNQANPTYMNGGNNMGFIPQNQYVGGYQPQQQQQIPTQFQQNATAQPYYGPTYSGTMPQNFQPGPYQQQQPTNYVPANSFPQTTYQQNNSYQYPYGGYQQQQQPGFGPSK